MAIETSRLLPNGEIGLMPIPDSGRTVLPNSSFSSAMSLLASSLPEAHSIPA